MTTFVGIQHDFMAAIKSLIELEYDALEAYKIAVNKLESQEYKSKLAEFMADHQRHITELSQIVQKRGEQPPGEPSIGKQWLTKGKVVLGALVGDKAILQAMVSNECDTNQAYDRMVDRVDQWEEAIDIIKRAREDEKRHKAVLEGMLQ